MSSACTTTGACVRVKDTSSTVSVNATFTATAYYTAIGVSTISPVASITATCNRVQHSGASTSMTSGTTTIGREKWESIAEGSESWTNITPSSDSWTEIAA
jgi:hypothetical protein